MHCKNKEKKISATFREFLEQERNLTRLTKKVATKPSRFLF